MYKGITPTPDSNFLNKLKEFDPQLGVKFFREFSRFVIIKPRAYGPPWQILLIETEDRQFRFPDERDIAALWLGDLWRHGGVEERITQGEERAKAVKSQEEKRAKETLREASRDDRRQLKNTWRKACNLGKGNADFRRVDIEQKGLTIDQIRSAKIQGQDPWAKQKVV